MRSVLALGLLIALCGSADAAPVHRSKPRPHVIVSPGQIVSPSQSVTAPGRFAVPSWSDDATRRWLDKDSAAANQA